MSDPKKNNDQPKPANDVPANELRPEGEEQESAAAAEQSSDIAREAAQIAALHAEIAELKERYLRAAAETENVRKRAEREKNEAAQFAFQRFAHDLLTVLDNFERALAAAKPEERAKWPPSATSVIEGIEATQRELLQILERHGVKPIEAKGQRFNPNFHQAIAEIPSDQPAGTVVEVAQRGYVIGERLLRAAMVAISAGGGKSAAPGNGQGRPGSTLDTSA